MCSIVQTAVCWRAQNPPASARDLSKVTEMDPRRLQEAMHVAGDAAEPARRSGISQASLSRSQKIRPERALSVEAVMDDMRTILWPDRCDQISAEAGPASTTRAQD